MNHLQDRSIEGFLNRHKRIYREIMSTTHPLADFGLLLAKHRKGATGIILMDFAGEFTRFENPEDNSIGNRAPTDGGEIRGSMVNGDGNNMPFPPSSDYNPFNVDVSNDYRGGNT